MNENHSDDNIINMEVPTSKRNRLLSQGTTIKNCSWTCDELTPDLCDLQVTEGSIPVRGDIHVHYWKYEDKASLFSKNHSHIPIIAIHGGPGWPHNYMIPLKQQACHGRAVYFYDQAGAGKSNLPNSTNTSVAEDYPWLLTSEYYATEELPQLIDHWGLDRYHIIGNSWGTVLSQYFALDASNTTGLQSMVLSGPFSQAKLYIDSQWSQTDGTLGSLPPFVQDQIHALEEEGAYDSPQYQAIEDLLTKRFTIRTAPPLPDCFVDAASNANEEIYVGMQGPSEFTIAGTLGDLNITHRLVNITVPVLLTHGTYDTMRPAVVRAMYDQLPIAETLLLTKSGHVSMIDEPKKMNDAVADFFQRVEQQTPLFAPQPSPEFHPVSISPSEEKMKDFVVWLPWKHLPVVVVALTTLLLAFGLGLTVGQHRERRRRRGNYELLS